MHATPFTSDAKSRSPLELLAARLMQAIGADRVLAGDRTRDVHLSDWSGEPASVPGLVMLPRTTAEVAACVALCAEAGQPLAVCGGLTGLAGGANPQAGEVALSLQKLDTMEPIDEMAGTVVLDAGVTLERLQAACEDKGWFFPLDLGARGSCQVGGNASTNAGGNRVLRYGMMRDSVLGMEVVLADGRVLSMLSPLLKDNAGLDLKHLFIGSEGVLGIITRLCLRLTPKPTAVRTALCALPDFASATRLLKKARQDSVGIVAFELMWRNYLEAACQVLGKRSPIETSHPLYALIECFGNDDPVSDQQFEQFLQGCFDQGLVEDAVLAHSQAQAAHLWDIREAIGELLGRMKPHAAFDVSLPTSAIEAFVDEAHGTLGQAFPAQQHLFFGHLGDGNLHLISGPYASQQDLLRADEIVYASVGEIGGSISAEHGIGFVKRPFLRHSCTPAEIDTMKALKRLFDPKAILNRDRIFAVDWL